VPIFQANVLAFKRLLFPVRRVLELGKGASLLTTSILCITGQPLRAEAGVGVDPEAAGALDPGALGRRRPLCHGLRQLSHALPGGARTSGSSFVHRFGRLRRCSWDR
jgi:hypothetical protein